MTYTLIARCPRSGAFGIGIATYSLAVGAKCPAITTGIGALTTQAFVNPTFKVLGLRLFGQGHPAEQVLDLLRGADPDFEYRQVALIDRRGDAACHTGTKTRQWSGHRIGDGFVALGNVLKGEAVLAAMAEAYQAGGTLELAERIMRSLKAGRVAGGQQGLDGPLPERSASLLCTTGRSTRSSICGSIPIPTPSPSCDACSMSSSPTSRSIVSAGGSQPLLRLKMHL